MIVLLIASIDLFWSSDRPFGLPCRYVLFRLVYLMLLSWKNPRLDLLCSIVIIATSFAYTDFDSMLSPPILGVVVLVAFSWAMIEANQSLLNFFWTVIYLLLLSSTFNTIQIDRFYLCGRFNHDYNLIFLLMIILYPHWYSLPLK